MDEKVVKVGIVGFGTVGSGVAKIILTQADAIAAKTRIRLQLAKVVDLDITSVRPITLPQGVLTDNLDELLNDESITIAAELVGGTTFAKDLQLKLLNTGKDVVTANKALLAEHGSELYETARRNQKCIAFEASCAGGIPIVSAIRSGLTANNITAMYGILNGTCNYILSNMSKYNKDFDEVVQEAKEKGYAEADPTLDISGCDSAHKLAILASIATGYEISYDDIYVEGIENISIQEIQYGKEMDYTLKLLAIVEKHDTGKISLRVHPSFISDANQLAQVDGPFNAVSIFGDAVGNLMLYGRGAGMMPTASAVVADIIDVALGNSSRTFSNLNIIGRDQTDNIIEKFENLVSRFYIRLMVKDQAGVFAQIGKILAQNQISISGILQHEGRGPENTVPVVITTHPTKQNKISSALKDLADLDTTISDPVCVRIVDIPEDKD